MSIATSIARTLKRLLLGGRVSSGVTWLPRLLRGLSKEFARVNDLKNIVLRAAVPSRDLPVETLDDLEEKYGIEPIANATDDERRNRIIERARPDGNGGPDWLQEVVQQAGFLLYVLPNGRIPQTRVQYGGTRYSRFTFYGFTPAAAFPGFVPGEIVTSSPMQKDPLSDPTDPTRSYPQPQAPTISPLPATWNRYIFLSPFPDRLASDSTELLSISLDEWRYLRRLVVSTKYRRDWAMVQVQIA